MKIYQTPTQLTIYGKVWEVRAKLKAMNKQAFMLQDYLRQVSPKK